jgi:hypothetical protein
MGERSLAETFAEIISHHRATFDCSICGAATLSLDQVVASELHSSIFHLQGYFERSLICNIHFALRSWDEVSSL